MRDRRRGQEGGGGGGRLVVIDTVSDNSLEKQLQFEGQKGRDVQQSH